MRYKVCSSANTMGFDILQARSMELQADGFLPYPASLDPLPPSLRRGLFAIGTLGLLSICSTALLLCFLTYRLFITQFLNPSTRHAAKALRQNQSIVLIYNLLLADFQQAVAFVLNYHWAHRNAILAPSVSCSAQGWFITIGDLSSGLFSLLIAAQTFATIVFRYQPSRRLFISGIVLTWSFAFAISMSGPLSRRGADEYYYSRADAWCWISPVYEAERLWLHYLWIFLCEFGSIALYSGVFWSLRRRLIGNEIATGPDSPLFRIARMMLLYPVAYTVFTLPLAAGRMSTLADNQPRLDFFVVAGALMGSCGWVDVALYTCTRRLIILLPGETVQDSSKPAKTPGTLRYGTITTIVNLKEMGSIDKDGDEQWVNGMRGSCENIVRLDQVVEVTVEDVETGLTDEQKAANRQKGINEGQHPWMK
jgi:hypothetical protein